MRKPIKALPSQETIKSLLDYDPETGVLRWKARSNAPQAWNTRWAGKVAGARGVNGLQVQIDWVLFYAHRLIWVYVHGDIESGKQIDHKNCDHFDNRLENLRPATQAQNGSNSRLRKGRRLPKGVTQDTRWRNRYFARITINNVSTYLGSFKDPASAHAAYWRATLAAKGEFARPE